jgi:hypothetical protein
LEIEDMLRTPLPKIMYPPNEFVTVGSALTPLASRVDYRTSMSDSLDDPLTAVTTVQRLKLASLEPTTSPNTSFLDYKSSIARLKRDSGYIAESPVKRKLFNGPSSDITVTDYGDCTDTEQTERYHYEIDDLLFYIVPIAGLYKFRIFSKIQMMQGAV